MEMRKTKRALALALSGVLALALCWTALPKTAQADPDPAPASQVTLYDGTNPTNPVVLKSGTTDYRSGSGGRAEFDPATGTLKLSSFQLTGSGNLGPCNSTVYAVGKLTIELHGANAIGMGDATNVAARVLWVNGWLTVTGTGSLRVTGGSGYSTPSMAISAKKLTVERGATLEAVTGSPAAGATSSYNGIQTEELMNEGRITAVGYTNGIFCNSGVSPAITSKTNGYLSATGMDGCGLLLGSFADFQVNGGVVELKGTEHPAVGPINENGPVRFTIGSAITSGRMGNSSASAATFSAREIMNHYEADSRSYAYLYLPAGAVADVPKTGDRTPLALLSGLILFSGAGLLVRGLRRRRKEER